MGELRAVRVSHELWKQIMTKGYTSGGWRCVKGLPEDAELVSVWIYDVVQPDPVFVFESDSWEGPAERETGYGENVYPECLPKFRTAECRTCKWWRCEEVFEDMKQLSGWGRCYKVVWPAKNDSKAIAAHWGIGDERLKTAPDFSCTSYEYRESDA